MEHQEQGPAGLLRTGSVGTSPGIAPPGRSWRTNCLSVVEGCSRGHQCAALPQSPAADRGPEQALGRRGTGLRSLWHSGELCMPRGHSGARKGPLPLSARICEIGIIIRPSGGPIER